jgi:hypothetical protein
LRHCTQVSCRPHDTVQPTYSHHRVLNFCIL